MRQAEAAVPERTSPMRRWLMRAVLAVFYVVLAVMLWTIGRQLDWAEAATAFAALPVGAILIAAACSLSCYALYAGYELLAARQARIALPRPQIAAIGLASYACNLSLGAMLGALGLRLRLYTARGIDAARVARVIAFNLMTNWSGYLLVLGTALLCLRIEPPPAWRVGATALQAIGVGLLAIVAGYLWACARAKRRTWRWRRLTIELPALRIALIQLALSVPVWLLGAASLHALLPQADFGLVLVTLLGSAVIGLVVRVPAGLGVVEAVFIASLGSRLGQGPLLAALLAYRCVHYLAPLALGLATFAALELVRRSKRPATDRTRGRAGRIDTAHHRAA